MNLSFYTAAVGVEQQQARLDVHGNNIANVNTDGFRAKVPVFTALMRDVIDGIDGEELPRGCGSRMDAATTNFSTQALAETGLPFDYAIEGNGFFALVDPATGEYSYTRDGSFTKSHYQIMGQDEDGNPALEDVWYLSDGRGRFVIGRDGRPVEVTSDKDELPVGVFDFINYDGMSSGSDNVFTPIEKNGQVQLGTGKLVQGYVETSNADLATEFVKVIETQRAFTYMLKMIQTSDEIETTVNSLR